MASEPRHMEGIKTLMGDPKRALLKLAWPMIVALSIQTIYNLVDAIWVSGLGADALAAVGFFYPFFFMAIAIAVGLGVGGGAAISRAIGARRKRAADSAASHTIIIMVILAIAFTLPFLTFARPIFTSLGAEHTVDMAASYGRVMFGGTIIIFFVNVATAILRAEGDAKRAMYALALGAVMNILLDPIFIYTLGLGVAGAAWATMLSLTATAILLVRWLFQKADTYVSFSFRGFSFDRAVLRDILRVGLPAMVMQLSMSITMLVVNVIIVGVASTDGVAVYTTGWRVVSIAIVPLLGISTAVVSVTGASYGARDYHKLDAVHLYAVKLGVAISLVIGVATYLLAPQIASVFTQSADARAIHDDLTGFLMVMCLFYPGVPFGMFSSSMFQGTGKGTTALLVTLFRTVLMTPPMALLLAYPFGMGLEGVWYGIVVANLTGSAVSFSWARHYINHLPHRHPRA